MADPLPEGYSFDPPAAVNPETGRLRITVAPVKVTAPVVTGPQALPEGYTFDPTPPSEGIPNAFLDRVAAGSALQKTMGQKGIVGGIEAFGSGLAEGFGKGFGEEPIGWSPEHVQQFRDLGIYRDPATGRGGPIRLFNESVMQPMGALGDLLIRGTSGLASGLAQGAANTFGALIEDAHGYLGNPEEARAEALNFLNERVMRGDAEFTRPHDGPMGPRDQVVGPLPRDPDFGRAAASPVFADANPSIVESNLRSNWRDYGIHPAEAVADAVNDDFLKARLTAPNWDGEGQTPRQAVGAEVTRDFPDMTAQPIHPPGALRTAVGNALTRLYDIKNDLQMKVAPMAADANPLFRAAAKDAANAFRRNRWEYDRIDDFLLKNFTPEQRKAIYDRSDEESVLRQEGKTSENMGIATLEPLERQAAIEMSDRAKSVWSDMRDLGMVKGEGLPFYTPRMVFNLATATEKDGSMALGASGGRLRTKTANMLQRKYLLAEDTEAAAKARIGEAATLVRDIRVTGLALRRLEDAIVARRLINEAESIGNLMGEQVVARGGQPLGSEHKWYTDPEHPAFKEWDTDYEEKGNHPPKEDQDGNLVFRQNQVYVRNDFAGPLKAILSERNGAAYNAFMALKSKSMSLVMNSPMIHNAVEYGRAFPAMPGKMLTLRVYFQGNAARKGFEYTGTINYIRDALTGNRVKVTGGAPDMLEAIDAGLVPIGRRFFNQDLSSIVEEPNLKPGRSLTAKLFGLVPGLWDEGKGDAVKAAIDRAGDVYHNTMLWDRIADLQMGLYVNFRNDMVGKGVDPLTAQRLAAHYANRFAGSLPQESMSSAARKFANFMMFSRTFTMGNLGVMKDAFTGVPKDVMSQIERDYGEFDPKAAGYAKSLARRKAAMVVATDIALFYITNSILQSASNVLRGDTNLTSEEQGYATRFYANLQRLEEDPMSAVTPLSVAGGTIGALVGGPPGAVVGTAAGFGLSQLKYLSSTYENEPGKQDRVLAGYTKDGTGIYGRNVLGKIGEEFTGYQSNPADMLFRKMFGIPRATWQILSNMNGFGQPLYDPNPNRPPKAMMGAIVKWVGDMMESLIPESQLSAGYDLLIGGQNDAKLDKLQAVGPLAGATFSKGFPGGPLVGEEHEVMRAHQYDFEAAIPELRKQIRSGDIEGARTRMTELNVPGWQQRSLIRSTLDPSLRYSARSLRDIHRFASPEARERLERGQSP